MKRGEVWTLAGGKDYADKPRPVVLVQDDRYDAIESITIVGLTSVHADAPIARPLVDPSDENGLRFPTCLMVDKITTVPRKRLGKRIGELAGADMASLNRAIIVFLSLAG